MTVVDPWVNALAKDAAAALLGKSGLRSVEGFFGVDLPKLHLSNSAFLAKYMHPALIEFMGPRRGRGPVLFPSDHPFVPMERALNAARALPLDEGPMADFLGGNAARLLEERSRG